MTAEALTQRPPTAETTYLAAILETLADEMTLDERVIVMGEDLRSGIYGQGAFTRFGPDRVMDTPISEAGFVGAAIGAALTGLRPVVDLNVSSFLFCAMDQIVSQAAKSRYMYGGQATIPLVIRASLYYGGSVAAHHSDRPYALFMHSPGLKIVVPSSASDAAGLMRAAIRDDNPVLFFDDNGLWGTKEALTSRPEDVSIGRARVRRPGRDVTVVAISGAVQLTAAAAGRLAADIDVEIIDPRSLVPLDLDTILDSVRKTGRLVIVDPAPRTCGAASEISASVTEVLLRELKSPVRRVTSLDVPVPFSPVLERTVHPSAERIEAAIREVAGD
jgi:pyruvate dehydrogenase E1 component beta subunit